MHVKKDDIPLVAAPHDEVWVIFRDAETKYVIWVQALTADARVEIASATTHDPALLSAAHVMTFTQAGIVSLALFGDVSASPVRKAIRIKPTAGRVAVSIAAPSDFRFYMPILRS